jgi:hypothetical protein
MSEAAYSIKCDLGKLSRFENGVGDLSAEKQAALECVLIAALRERAKLIEELVGGRRERNRVMAVAI